MLAAAVLPLTTGVAAQPLDPDSRDLARETVAGVRLESIAESDGGRLVRMRRSGRDYSFEYWLEYWRGNGGVVVGATFRGGTCRSGDAGAIEPTDQAMARETLDVRLGEYLRLCPLVRGREADLRHGLDRAWPPFLALAEAALAATIAENRAIEKYGDQE